MGKLFKRGLIAIAPLSVTIVVLIWLLESLEQLFRKPIVYMIGERYYFPGLGIIVAFIFIILVGAIINTWIIQKCTKWINRLFARIPFIKAFYNSIYDLMNYFQPKETKQGRVVMVEWMGTRVMGFITREDFENLPKGIALPDEVAIYIPMSYQIGGFTVMVPRHKISVIDLTVEEGMRFVVMAGVTSKAYQS